MENFMKRETKITYDKWADDIDDCKAREAIHDMSVLAYRMAKVILSFQTDKSCALYVDYEKSCEALRQRKIELKRTK